MQDQLRELLGILDDNSEHLPNGDYLNAMNLLNNLYSQAQTGGAPRFVPPPFQLNLTQLRDSIGESIDAIFDDFVAELMGQLRVPPVPPVPPVPDIPDRRGLDNPNIPRQGGGPHFETREERAVWILQNDKEECSLCHRIIARGDSRRHQQRQICQQTRSRYRF